MTETVQYQYTPSKKQAMAHQVMARELLFGGAAGGGKALGLDTPVLTPSGWTTHGALRPGDEVFHPDGRPVRVTAISPIHRVSTYRVTFSNGEELIASEGHLWAVQDERARERFKRADPAWKARRRATRASRAKTTDVKNRGSQEAVSRLNSERAETARRDERPPYVWDYVNITETRDLDLSGRKRLSVPYHDGTPGTGPWISALPPWAYGMWLGDGCRGDGYIAQGHDDAPELISQMDALGCRFTGNNGHSYRFRAPDGRTFRAVLQEEIGDVARGPLPKRVPDWAYIAPWEDREALLAGLIDSDGHVKASGAVEFSITDGDLAGDVRALLATLGYRAAITTGKASYRKDGELRVTGTRYTIKFTPSRPAARYPRKRIQANPTTRTRSVYITSVEQVETVETSCITVDDPSGLYLAGRSLIPTHNSRWARAELVIMALMVPGSRSIIFRRSYPDLEQVEDDMKAEMPAGVATYKPGPHRWEFSNGSIIRLAHLGHDDDVYKYQGQEFALIAFEEATQFSSRQYLYMLSRLRVSGAVKDRMEELGWIPRAIATTNPGGRSHAFFKERFVDANPPFQIFRPEPTDKEPNPGTRCFIPATVWDNPHLNESYIDDLDSLPEQLQKAYKYGDWNIVEGARFSQWRDHVHVISPKELPISAMTGRKVIAVDYGYRDPFAAVWLCKLHDGLIVQYREAYEREMTPEQQAELIRDLSADEEATTGDKIPVVMDPAMWRRDQAGPKPLDPDAPPVGSQAHAYQKILNRQPIRAVNSRAHGWSKLDEKLRIRDDGFPRYMVYDSCRDTIRTLPTAPTDRKNPEDVDTTSEDHLLDAVRYGIMYLEGVTVAPREAPAQQSSRRRSGGVTAGVRTAGF